MLISPFQSRIVRDKFLVLATRRRRSQSLPGVRPEMGSNPYLGVPARPGISPPKRVHETCGTTTRSPKVQSDRGGLPCLRQVKLYIPAVYRELSNLAVPTEFFDRGLGICLSCSCSRPDLTRLADKWSPGTAPVWADLSGVSPYDCGCEAISRWFGRRVRNWPVYFDRCCILQDVAD